MRANDPASGYWYLDDEDSQRATAVLNAMRRYRAAEADMERRTRTSMGLGETDLAAIRHLIDAAKAGRMVSPKEISETLGISTASTTKLVDRLAAAGYVARRPHPTDRRGLVIVPTWDPELESRSSTTEMQERLGTMTESLSADETRVIAAHLSRMIEAVEVADQER